MTKRGDTQLGERRKSIFPLNEMTLRINAADSIAYADIGWRSKALGVLVMSLFAAVAFAQAPSSIQFFMPDGSLPPGELRFSRSSDQGRVDTFFTDSKGRFLITRSQGLKPDARYTVTVQGDGATYDTTSVSFQYYSVYYVPVLSARWSWACAEF